MSSSMLKGKTKSDLIEIAHLTGLLTKTQMNRMTKAEILEFLENAENGTPKDSEPAKMQKTTGKKKSQETKSDLIEIAHLTGLLTKTQMNRMTKAEILEFLENAENGTPKDSEPAKMQKTTGKKKSQETKTETIEKDSSETIDLQEEISTDNQSNQKNTNNSKTSTRTSKTSTSKSRKTSKQDNKNKEEVITSSLENSETSDSLPIEKETDSNIEKEAKPKKKNTSKKRTPKKSISKKEETKSDGAVSEVTPTPIEVEKTEAPAKKKNNGRKKKATEKKIIDLNNVQSEDGIQQDDAKLENSDDAKQAADNRPKEELEIVQGILEIMPDNYGFLRVENYLQSNRDVYIPPQFIRRFYLRNGDEVSGPAKVQRESDRYRALTYINTVNGLSPDKMMKRQSFDRLTPIYPNEKYKLETQPKELATRMIDLISPIGKGQRGMIVSPPKAGKTILLQKIANAISMNNPDTKLFVLLIDERPEEVTDMQRSINGEVVYSTFDKTPENHVKVTELVLERAMRLVELGQDVVILLDSITRMSRAYNLTINPTGRTLSGGLDPGALHGPKRFFGAARNIENGGSLTIIATALVETGSRMDEVIFEEFKGTGNMEVCLDRKLAEKRVFPAIDLNRSGTRREELLMTKEELNTVWAMRKAFANSEPVAVTETMINLLLKTRSNEQFANSISVSIKDQDLFEAMRGSISPMGNSDNNSSNGRANSNGNGIR